MLADSEFQHSLLPLRKEVFLQTSRSITAQDTRASRPWSPRSASPGNGNNIGAMRSACHSHCLLLYLFACFLKIMYAVDCLSKQAFLASLLRFPSVLILPELRDSSSLRPSDCRSFVVNSWHNSAAFVLDSTYHAELNKHPKTQVSFHLIFITSTSKITQFPLTVTSTI